MSNELTFYNYAKKYETCIPIIQRDYVQGRKGDKESHVLKRFLEAIGQSLDKKERLELNFIYGVVDQGTFFPIDGQQRLTTLYLLHWLTALKSGCFSLFNKELKVFTYKTRSSSIDFFDAIRNPDNIMNVNTDNPDKFESDIRFASWFKANWNNDPTVNAAIEALCKMISVFTNADFSKWQNLLAGDDCPIVFQWNNINETDALQSDFENECHAASIYIKMNARGKPLTEFENAKALIHSLNGDGENFVKKYDLEYIIKIDDIVDHEKKLDVKYFSSKIDTMMIQFLINLYNDLKIWHDEKQDKDKVSNYYEFMDELRNYAESENKNNTFYHDYFLLIETIFNCDIYKQEEFLEYCRTENRPARLQFCSMLALVWKCGYNKNCMDEYIYLLNNLHFFTTKNNRHENTADYTVFARVMRVVLDMAEKIANSGNSVREFVLKTPCYDKIDEVPSVRPLDWTEEHIKAKFLANEDLPINYFNDIENDFNRRIRVFLFISGYWDGNGEKTELEKYIHLAKCFDLKGDTDPHIAFKKMFYLFATGYNGIEPISRDPTINFSLYFWGDNDKKQTEKIYLFKRTLDFLHFGNLRNYEELSNEIKTIANKLYHDKDWRSLVLLREYEFLFSSLYRNVYSAEQALFFIPIAVMMKDINAKSGFLVYMKEQYRGTVGQNTQTNRRITNKSRITININLDCQNKEKYIFYTTQDTRFSVYEYSGFDDDKHCFSVKTFDISRDVEVLNGRAEDIRKKIKELDNKTKTAFMSDSDDDNVKEEFKNTYSDCELNFNHWRYDIVSKFSQNISINLDDADRCISAKETLGLDKDE